MDNRSHRLEILLARAYSDEPKLWDEEFFRAARVRAWEMEELLALMRLDLELSTDPIVKARILTDSAQTFLRDHPGSSH